MNAPDRKPLGPLSAVAPRYEGDFFAWSRDQAERLKSLRPDGLDWSNLAEEIESLGRTEKREIRSRMAVLLLHLLKWEFQPTHRSESWRASIYEQRSRIKDDLKESPSLREYPAQILHSEYRIAKANAAAETKLPPDAFPADCPYEAGQVLDFAFLPGAPDG